MIGKTISHYNIIEKLGGGGMGVVYKAEDTKLKRTVALKFLPPGLTRDPDSKKRFIHEAQAASALEHQNICTVFEIDETEEGQCFISMSYCEGETLSQKIKDKPIEIEEAIDIVMQVAQGLDKAHKKGIVHRDIKPANIMITEDNVAKIVDFGLAKLAGQTKLTKEGATVGTIAYMSPEQAKGNEVDARSDIWSLGIVFYEMITGQLPFKGEYDQAILYSILNEEPQPLSEQIDNIPNKLGSIVDRCLIKDPSKRYQKMDDFIEDLYQLTKELNIDVRSVRTYRKAILIKKPIKYISIAASLVVILLVGWYLLFQLNNSEWENSIAILPFDDLSQAGDKEWFCNAMTEQIISNLSKLNRLKVIARQSVMKYKESEKSISEIGQELNVSHILKGSILIIGDRMKFTAQLTKADEDFPLWSDDYSKDCEDLFDIQDEVSQTIATNLLDKLSEQEITEIKTNRPSNTEAYEYYIKGRDFHHKYWRTFQVEDLKTSEEMLKKAIDLDPNYADSYASLADVYDIYQSQVSKTTEEEKYYGQARDTYLESAFRLDSTSAEVHFVKGWALWDKIVEYNISGEYIKHIIAKDKVLHCFKRALKINSNHDKAYEGLGILFQAAMSIQNISVKYLTKSIELNPLNVRSYTWRGMAYYDLGEFDKAEQDYKKQLEIEPNHMMALQFYSKLLVAMKRYEEAEKLIDRMEKAYPDRDFRGYRILSYAAKGEKEKALNANKARNGKLGPEVCALLDMKEEAVSILIERCERQFKMRFSMYYTLKTNPCYANIRDDLRFQEILTKHKKLYEENLQKYGDIDI